VNHPYDLTYKYVFILETYVEISDDDDDESSVKIGKVNYER